MTDSQNRMQPKPTGRVGQNTKSKGRQGLIAALLAGITLILVLMIYNSLFPEEYWSLRELKQNQAKWESQHIKHYRMSVDSNDDGGLLPVTVEVKDGNIVSVVDAQGIEVLPHENIDTAYNYQDWFTIPGLFSYVSRYYLEKPASMRVSYDTTFGFPLSIYIDPYTEPCCQDFEIVVQDFQVLP